MTTATRRTFVAGALASAAAPAVARAQGTTHASPMQPQAKRATVRRGRAIAVSPKGDRVVVAHAQRRTIAVYGPGRTPARLVDVGGQPLEVAVSPNGRLAAVTTASWDEPGLALVNLRGGTLLARVPVGPAPFDVAFSTDARRLIVSGGEQEGTVHVLDTHSLKVVTKAAIGTVPRGMAPVPGGQAVWIALNGDESVVRMDLRTGRVRRTIRTPRLPDRVAISPDGRHLLVSHGGRDAEYVSQIDVKSGRLTRRRVGRLPSAVAWTRAGRRVVALGGTGELLVFGGKRRTRRIRVGGSPRGLAVAGNGVWTADALTEAVRRVRT
jgi:DNA-binding beta-propeller fold protein YncE